MCIHSIRILPFGGALERRKGEYGTPRKCVVKVVLSRQQKDILCELARRLGTSESEMLRLALMDYAKELSLMKEAILAEKSLLVEN